jgi:hypothetical protein
VQPFTFERKFQMVKIALAWPVSLRIHFNRLFGRGMSVARAVGDQGLDVIGRQLMP